MRYVPTVLAISNGLSVRQQLDQARKDALLRAAANESMARIRRQDTVRALSFLEREVAKSLSKAKSRNECKVK